MRSAAPPRVRPIDILSLLFAASIAGCAAPAEDPVAPGSRSIIEPTTASDWVTVHFTNSTGALVGQVVDRYEVPILGAHGALIGTDHSTASNDTGWFRFVGLSPATYYLRIDHPHYRAAESEVSVQAGNSTHVTVRLVELPGTSAAARPHPHDYWGGRSRVSIMDDIVKYHTQEEGGLEGPMQPYTGAAKHVYTGGCLSGAEIRSGSTSGIKFPDAEQLVWPGTEAIEVTLDWTTQDYPHDKLSLVWHPANSREYVRSPLFSKGTIFSIPVLPGQPDSGHQRFTSWDIAMCTSEAGETASYGRPFPGNVHVKIDLVGGKTIPSEPAHPEFWINGSTLPVINETKVIPYSPNQYWLTTARGGRYDFTFFPTEKHLVPPATAKLSAKLQWSYDGVVNTRPLTLTYSPANVAPWDQWKLDTRIAPVPVQDDGNVRVYEIPVAPEEMDTVYQRLSNWAFYWNFEGEEEQDYALHNCACRLQVDLEVLAVKAE